MSGILEPRLSASKTPLKVHYISSSVEGLQSNTVLIEGEKEAILIDAPFLIPDAEKVVSWAKEILGSTKSLRATFVTHHHPDHYFSFNPIGDAFPDAKFYAHQYVVDGINREYDDKVVFWPKLYGDKVPTAPRKPEVYPYSFIVLAGNSTSPIHLLGPVQGDSIDHTLFWLPKESTLITGDAMYGRSVHAWVEELETKELLSAWQSTLDLIESLDPSVIIPGPSEAGWTHDAKADLAYCRKYLDLFAQKITYAEKKPSVDEIFKTFKDSFPDCKENHEFFLGMVSQHYGEGGKKWEENAHHKIEERTTASLEGWILGKGDKVGEA